MTQKNLEYYLALDYDVAVSRLESDGEFSYKAYSRDLDSLVFYGTGDTREEALHSFEETKNELFEVYLEEGRHIPEPTRESNTLPSGRFVLRLDPRVHYSLIQLSKEARKSLNSYVDQVLVSHVAGMDAVKKLIGQIKPAQTTSYRPREVIGECIDKDRPCYTLYSTNDEMRAA